MKSSWHDVLPYAVVAILIYSTFFYALVFGHP